MAAAKEPNQITDRARAAVQWAFLERAGASGSIFEIFSGKETKSAKLPHGRRNIGLSGTRVHAIESPKSGKSKIPIASGRSGGEVKRAIWSLPPIEQNWVQYCYNPSASKKFAVGKMLSPALWELYKSQSDFHGLHGRTQVIMSFMLRIQLEQAKSYADLQQWTNSRPKQFMEIISASSWCDTHKAHWSDIHAMIERVDEQTMTSIYYQLGQNGLAVAE